MVVSKEIYEREIERISPKLEELKDRPFDEIMKGLYNEVFLSPISVALVFALTYVLDPDRFFIEEVNYDGRWFVKFKANTPLGSFGTFVSVVDKSGKRPTDKEARDFIKEFLEKKIKVEGLIEKAKEVVNTCKVIQD